jgi:transposase
MTRISVEKRARILLLLEQGHSVREIGSLEGVSHSSVVRIGQKSKTNNSSNHALVPMGRPRIFSDREERNILRLLSSGQCSTAVDIKNTLLANDDVDVSAETLRNVLRRNGLESRIKRKKPLLTRKHRQCRLLFAKKYRNWTMEDWNRVIWSDESKFTVFGSDGREYCWKKPTDPLRPQHVKPTVKYGGGNIMVWGCFSSHGIGFLCRIEEGLDAELYKQILNEDLMETLAWYDLNVSDVIFQHDNDPKHTAKSTKRWLDETGFEVLYWPAQSPDLNPIEHLWNEVDRRLKSLPNRPSSREELWERLQDAWNTIDLGTCKKLIDTMPARIHDVLKAKGGYTRW